MKTLEEGEQLLLKSKLELLSAEASIASHAVSIGAHQAAVTSITIAAKLLQE